MTNTRQLAQDVHVPAKAAQNVADMQPGNRNGAVARESEALAEAKLHKGFVREPRKTGHNKFNHLGRVDHD